MPARQSFMVEMTSHEDLMNAISLNSSIVNGARVVGPAVAGFLMARVGMAWCFLLNGVNRTGLGDNLHYLPGFLPVMIDARTHENAAGATQHPSAQSDGLEVFVSRHGMGTTTKDGCNLLPGDKLDRFIEVRLRDGCRNSSSAWFRLFLCFHIR
jgi:hypothetical protein